MTTDVALVHKSIVEQRVNGITLAVKDLSQSRAFYCRLGWRESTASNDSIAFFDMNGLVLSLYPFVEFYSDRGADPVNYGFVPMGSIALSQRSKAQVDEVLIIAENAGAIDIVAAKDREWGGRSGYFSDLDGHLWEVLWNPNFLLDESGRTLLPSPTN